MWADLNRLPILSIMEFANVFLSLKDGDKDDDYVSQRDVLFLDD